MAARTSSKKRLVKQITKNLQRVNSNQIAYIVLLIATFFLGYLFAKVQYLESGSAGPVNTAAAAAPAAGNQAGAAVTPGAPVDVNVGNFPVRGNKDAKVTIVEFADFRCPFCEQLFQNVIPSIMKDYVDTGKVKFYFRNYAFLGPASTVAANAAECANEQEKFWEMHDYFYKNQPSETDTSMYNTDTLTQIAGTLGMDTNQFQSCLSSNKYSSNVSQDLSDGQKAGVSGTPTVFIDGMPIVGAQPYSSFKTVIDQELAKN